MKNRLVNRQGNANTVCYLQRETLCKGQCLCAVCVPEGVHRPSFIKPLAPLRSSSWRRYLVCRMWSFGLGLCLLLSVSHGAEPTDPDPSYMLLVPAVLKAGKEEKICMQLSHLNESVTVGITLETPTENLTLSKEVPKPGGDCCVTFRTPNVDSAVVAAMSVNAVSDTLQFRSTRNVLIKPLQNLVFVQCDKPIYKPGQTVQFRIASLDETFHSVQEEFPVVYVEDPQGNRISQWLHVTTNKGLAQESFLLSSEPRLGTYKLLVQRHKGEPIQQTFSVEEYVLPKYDVQVTVPKIITILDEEMTVSVCGRYTYGKPVAGKIDVHVCRKFTQSYSSCRSEEDSVCEDLSHQADKNGCYSEVVKTKLFQLKRTGYEMEIVTSAKITEDGTGVELTGQGSSELKSTIAKVSFRQLDSQFKRGLPLYGQIFLEDAAGKPIANDTVILYVGSDGTNFTYTTGPDGTTDFSLNTMGFSWSYINLRVTYKKTDDCYRSKSLTPLYEEASRHINHIYSRTNSFLKIQPIYRTLECGADEAITVHYSVTPEGVGDSTEAIYHYLIMSKGGIVDAGSHKVTLMPKQESHGHFTVPLPVSVNTAPLARLLVYLVLNNGEVIADGASFKVKRCFANKVKLSFSDCEALPGSHIDLVLTSNANSLCAVRAVDSSVLLLKPEAELSAKSVYDLLPIADLSGYHHDGHYLEEPRDDPCLKLEPIFMNGVYYKPTSPVSDFDAYSILKQLGLKIFTNTKIRTPYLCQQQPETVYYHSPMRTQVLSPMAMSAPPVNVHFDLDGPIIETVRKIFPETWLWNLVLTDADGQSTLKLTIPDTITTWDVGMFCTSEDTGFGLAEPISLVVFQPFFLDLTLPYSAIRGEELVLKATVFNYLQRTIKVRVSLENSENFAVKNANMENVYCVEANGRVTGIWEVTLLLLGEVDFTVSAQTLPAGGLCGNEIVDPVQGRKDTITKQILVEPEGIKKEETHTAMVCGKDVERTEKIPLELPSHVVNGSARAYFSVIGDIMGTALQNLGKLVQLPTGCGEQNMVLFTPIIYVLEYMNNTRQLTPKIKSKALSYLSTGYQRQLTYKHSDGAYSTFGPPYSVINTWLTAFVLKSFSRAKSHIYIDPTQLSDTLTWISTHQKQNGCFHKMGSLFNNAMKGGVNDDVTLAAYITVALLEYPLPVTHAVVRNALFCLESALAGDLNIYTQAIMAYAFTLAGKDDIRSQLLQSLEEKAIKKDGTVHWHRPEFSDDSEAIRAPHSKAPSIEVEMTSYVLLAKLSKPGLTDEDLTEATKVVSWIIQQQNPMGGFSSTQDTVIALQALALYGYHALSHDGPRDISVTLDDAQVAKLHVEDSNRLLLQRVPLPTVPANYMVSINGPGCVYMQASLKYNVPHTKEDAPFSISVATVTKICDIKSLRSFTIVVNVSYIGTRENSNMAIVEVKLPSGYIPVKATVRQISFNHHFIGRAEPHPNKVVVYYNSVPKITDTFTFRVEQDFPVSNLQPATVTITDYYETDEFAVTEYTAPCRSKDDVRHA